MQDDFVFFNEEVEEESFWPSFADIMMVTTIIFLFVMVILVIKNWDLVVKLNASMIAEKKFQEEIAVNQEKLSKLLEKIGNSEEELSRLHLQMLGEQEEKYRLREQLMESRQREDKIGEENKFMFLENKELQNQILTLKNRQLLDQQEISHYRKEVIDLKKQTKYLQAEHEILQEKYKKLIRPARSPKGRYVVNIFYRKAGSRTILSMKTQDSEKIALPSTKVMEEKLKQLKQKKGDQLYIKVIFPEDEAISHKEAWKFTTKLLQRYDYYYQY